MSPLARYTALVTLAFAAIVLLSVLSLHLIDLGTFNPEWGMFRPNGLRFLLGIAQIWFAGLASCWRSDLSVCFASHEASGSTSQCRGRWSVRPRIYGRSSLRGPVRAVSETGRHCAAWFPRSESVFWSERNWVQKRFFV